MSHDAAGVCECVADHRPTPAELHVHHVLPLSWGGGDTAANRVWLCPTAHVNVHELLAAYRRSYGVVPWDVRRRFSAYVRALAARGWDAYTST